MATVYWVWGLLVGGAWLYKLVECALGMPKLPDLIRDEFVSESSKTQPRVSIIVPALNEEEKLEAALRSLLALEYSNYEVVAIDDRSTDRTGAIMDRLAVGDSERLKVLHIHALPQGWLGKPHALQRGSQAATGEWLLFTDADIQFRPDTLRLAVAFGQQSNADHVVIFPTLIMRSWGERMMLAFLSLAFAVRRPWKVSDPKASDFIGVGAFNMIRRRAFDSLGGMHPLKMEVVEDMKLGKLVKMKGLKQVAAFGDGLLTIHWASGAWGIVRNLRKNTFAFLEFRWYFTLAAIILLILFHWGPLIGLVLAPGLAKIGFAVGLASLALFYVGISRHLRISPLYFLLHPISTGLMCVALIQSTWFTLLNRGIDWRGTRYPLNELRKGLV